MAFLVLLAAPVPAQTVELRVTEDSSSVAIAGAIVRLLDHAHVLAQGLTSATGTLVLRAPRPGTFRLRIDRIGWTGLTTDPFTLDSTETLRLRVPMASRRMHLPTLEVAGKSRCDARAQGGSLAAALWDETEKALTANLITQAARATPIHLKEFVREVSLEEKPGRQWTVVSRIVRGPPFRSLPAAGLMNAGFIQQVGDSAEFAAPDAALLLSEEFVATHCFLAVPGSGGLVGLAFEPMPGRKVPDVTGTLWVDRASSELKFLEYRYTRLPGLLGQARLGGRVAFSRLLDGRWIVNDWHVRMPQVATTQEYIKNDWRDVTRISGYLDRGGRAVVALDARGRVDRAIVRGRVFDSIAGGGLAGAFVGVVGTRDSVTTDHDGRFELAVQASGDQVIVVRHRKLEVTPDAAKKTALLSLDDTTEVNFATPPLETVVNRFCRNRNPPGTIGIVGTARRVDGSPATNLGVFWVSRSGRSAPVHPDRTGLYGLCRVPARDTVEVVLGDGNINLTGVRILPGQGSRWLELRELGSTDTIAARFPSDSVLTASTQQSFELLEPAVVRGRVRDSITGLGVAGARVRIAGARDSAVTDSTGGYALRADGSGQRTLTTSHPRLDLVGDGTRREALLSLGDTTEVSFAVIPLQAVVQRLCGFPGDRAGLLGIAYGNAGGPAEHLPIMVQYRLADRTGTVTRRSGSGGVYAFCDLPPGVDLRLSYQHGAGRSGGTIRLERREFRWQNLRPSESR